MVMSIVQTALTNPTLGQIARIAQRRAACPAQVSLIIVQSFAMEIQLVQMLGMSYSLTASPKSLLKKKSATPTMLLLNYNHSRLA